MSKFLRAALAVTTISVLASSSALQAYDLKPIILQLTPNGAGASQQMSITNTHKFPIAIEVKAFKRDQLPDGSDALTAEQDDVLISPPQMVIQPGSSQAFRVRWVGDASPSQELSYRIVTTQLPIQFKSDQGGGRQSTVNLSYRYEAALYITPPNSKPDVSLGTVEATTDEKGIKWLAISLKNNGNARALLSKPQITVRSSGGGEAVSTGANAAILENMNILAGKERVVRIPWPENLPNGSLTGEVKTDYTILR
jgi:fimbrial chaperone protein